MCLFVLDNFEQVVTAAPLLAELLRASSGLRLLVTSRIVLGLSGEHVVAVPPLEVPAHLDHRSEKPSLAQLLEVAAVRLFVDRSMAASSTFVVTDTQAQTLVDICRRLDGLPLAIELAAARTRCLSPAALMQRLKHRLPVLIGGARVFQPVSRHCARPSTGVTSYSRRQSSACSGVWRVLEGGWPLEAAEAVCALDGDAVWWS